MEIQLKKINCNPKYGCGKSSVMQFNLIKFKFINIQPQYEVSVNEIYIKLTRSKLQLCQKTKTKLK